MRNSTISATLKVGLTVNNPPVQKLLAGLANKLPIVVITIGVIIILLIIWKKRKPLSR